MLSRKWKLEQEEIKLAEAEKKLKEARKFSEKDALVVATKNFKLQEQITNNAIWQLNHPFIDVIHEHLPLEITLICVSYTAGGWCIYHEKLHLGSECLRCLDPRDNKASWWRTCGDFVMHEDCENGHICIVPRHDEDKLLVKEWMDIKRIHGSNVEKELHCKNEMHQPALRVRYDKITTIKSGTYLMARLISRKVCYRCNSHSSNCRCDTIGLFNDSCWIISWKENKLVM